MVGSFATEGKTDEGKDPQTIVRNGACHFTAFSRPWMGTRDRQSRRRHSQQSELCPRGQRQSPTSDLLGPDRRRSKALERYEGNGRTVSQPQPRLRHNRMESPRRERGRGSRRRSTLRCLHGLVRASLEHPRQLQLHRGWCHERRWRDLGHNDFHAWPRRLTRPQSDHDDRSA